MNLGFIKSPIGFKTRRNIIWKESSFSRYVLFMRIINNKSPGLWFVIILSLVFIVSILGPSEATLGSSARVVYLHGAWVWVSLIAFIAAGGAGLLSLFNWLASKNLSAASRWSRAFGRTGLVFWVTYLPLSLWAMQSNWNGLFLAEPRWRIAVIFAISGTLLQLGLSLLPVFWSSIWNLVYVLALFVAVGLSEQVMHPDSPILNSDAWRIQIFFFGLLLLLIAAAWQMTKWFHSKETKGN